MAVSREAIDGGLGQRKTDDGWISYLTPYDVTVSTRTLLFRRSPAMSNRSLFSSAGKGPKQPKPHHDLLSGGGAGGRPYMNARAAQSCSEGPSERFSPSQASFIGPFSPIAPVVTPADSNVRKSTDRKSTRLNSSH